MGKQARLKKERRGQPPSDTALIDEAFATLGVPDGRDEARWRRQVVAELGPSVLADFDRLRNDSNQELYDLIYCDVRTAIVIGSGLRSAALKAELAWLLRLLRRDVPNGDAVILEVGSGSGSAAAVVSRALGRRVIAVDAAPGARMITSQVAAKLGADVEPHTGTCADLVRVLDGRAVGAVYALSTVRYLDEHQHPLGYSYEQQWAATQSHQASGELQALMAVGAASSGLYVSEFLCADRVGELQGCAARVDLGLVPEDIRMVASIHSGGEKMLTLLSFLPGRPAPDPSRVMAALGGKPAPLRAGLSLQSLAAEATRSSLPRLERSRSIETVYNDGSGTLREEVGVAGKYAIDYQAATTGYRQLKVAQRSELAAMVSEVDAYVSEPNSHAAVRLLDVGSEEWT